MRTVTFILCLFALLSATYVNAEQEINDPRSAQAEQLAEQLMGQLKHELLAGLKQGPEAAINICRQKAPQIAQQLTTPGVQIGRVSHRPRNPNNRVQSWQEGLMAEYLKANAPQPAKSVLLANGSLALVKPIYMVAPCLRCHGENISPQLSHEIALHYPQDQAQGFKLGEFRGLTWVIIK
ncbi:MAG: DUF3365 domain-containing protein [Desulfuromonas sp.]|nr:DUF3365 domain-containing protein [Desulfuromonas sp.]